MTHLDVADGETLPSGLLRIVTLSSGKTLSVGDKGKGEAGQYEESSHCDEDGIPAMCVGGSNVIQLVDCGRGGRCRWGGG